MLPTSSSSTSRNKECVKSRTRPSALLLPPSGRRISPSKSVTFWPLGAFNGALITEAPNDQAIT